MFCKKKRETFYNMYNNHEIFNLLHSKKITSLCGNYKYIG
jgi:hypothetical protein